MGTVRRWAAAVRSDLVIGIVVAAVVGATAVGGGVRDLVDHGGTANGVLWILIGTALLTGVGVRLVEERTDRRFGGMVGRLSWVTRPSPWRRGEPSPEPRLSFRQGLALLLGSFVGYMALSIGLQSLGLDEQLSMFLVLPPVFGVGGARKLNTFGGEK